MFGQTSEQLAETTGATPAVINKEERDAFLRKRKQDIETAKRKAKKGELKSQFDTKLGTFDEHQQTEFERLSGLFRDESDLRQARSRNTAFTSLNQAMARRGIRGPAEGAGVRDVEVALLSQMSQEQADFGTRLAQLQSAQRAGFIQREFDFFNELQRMEVAFDYQKILLELQAEIAADQQKASGILDFLGLAGAVATSLVFPPAAPFVLPAAIQPFTPTNELFGDATPFGR